MQFKNIDAPVKCAICGDTKGYEFWNWNFKVCKSCAVALNNNQPGCIRRGFEINWFKQRCFVCGKIEARMWNANPALCEQCAYHYGYLHYRTGSSGKSERGEDSV